MLISITILKTVVMETILIGAGGENGEWSREPLHGPLVSSAHPPPPASNADYVKPRGCLFQR